MTNKKFMMEILVMALVFGIALVGCASLSGGGANSSSSKATASSSGASSGSSGASSGLNGTWDGASRDVLTFNNGDFEFSSGTNKMLKGTYTVSGSTVTLKSTDAWGRLFTNSNLQAKWYSKANLLTAGAEDSSVNQLFSPMTGTLNGNKLDLSYRGSKSTFTKRGGTTSSGSQTGRYMLINSDTLNVRSGPSADYSVVGVLTRNARVEVLDRPGQWWKIKSGNIEGYVNSSYLKEE